MGWYHDMLVNYEAGLASVSGGASFAKGRKTPPTAVEHKRKKAPTALTLRRMTVLLVN